MSSFLGRTGNNVRAVLDYAGLAEDFLELRGDGAPDDVIARIDEEAELFKAQLGSPEARAAFEAFLGRKK